MIGLNYLGGSLMFSMPKIMSPLVVPDGPIDASCMLKVVQRVLIAVVGDKPVIVDRGDVQPERPFFCFPFMADFRRLDLISIPL